MFWVYVDSETGHNFSTYASSNKATLDSSLRWNDSGGNVKD